MFRPTISAKKKRAGDRAALLAERAARREQHAALVVARAGDPRFLQRTRTDDGFEISIPGQYSAYVHAAMDAARQAFRDKFGREPGPDDPLIFDPDADEPVAMSEQKVRADILALAEKEEDPELKANLLAWADLGYIITEGNQHTFTAHEVQAFFDAVEDHR